MNPSLSGGRRAAGFTLIELLVVLALASILMAIGLPNLFNFIYRQKILGITQETAILLRLARLEAIKTANNSVVQIDTDAGTVTAFADLDQDKVFDSNERQIGFLRVPKGVTFGTVDGFTTPPTPGVAIFRSNGSVAAIGGFRFTNAKGDQLEARVLTQNSGRIQILKLQGGTWKAQGEGGQSWTWQ